MSETEREIDMSDNKQKHLKKLKPLAGKLPIPIIASRMGVSQSYVRHLASVEKISLRLPLEVRRKYYPNKPKK